MSATTEQSTMNLDDLNFDELELEQFEDSSVEQENKLAERSLSFFKNIPVMVTLEVSSTEVSLGELMRAGEGSVLELDKLNGEPLDVKVNGALMGHAEVVVVNEKYGLRLIDVVNSPLNSLDS